MPLPSGAFSEEERALLRLWDQSARRLERIVSNIEATSFQRYNARILLDQVRAAMGDLRRGTADWLDRTVPKSFEYGFRWTGSKLNPQNWSLEPIVFGVVQRPAIEAIAAEIARDVGEALDSVAAGLETTFIRTQQTLIAERAVLEAVSAEVVAGKGPLPLARELARAFRSGARVQLRGAAPGVVSEELKDRIRRAAAGQFITIDCRDGITRHYGVRYYSELVARTATRMAQTEGTLTSCRQLGVDLVQWSVHANPCTARCLARQGKVFSISGNNPDFPPLMAEDRTPAHPHCAHVLLPAPEAFLRRRGLYDSLSAFSSGSENVEDFSAYQAVLKPTGAAA